MLVLENQKTSGVVSIHVRDRVHYFGRSTSESFSAELRPRRASTKASTRRLLSSLVIAE